MTEVDKYLSGIAAALVVAAVVIAIVLWVKNNRNDPNSYDDYLDEVHQMKQYASYFISAIAVFLALTIRASFNLERTALAMLLSAFVAAAITVAWVPTTSREPKVGRKVWIPKFVSLNLSILLTLIALMDAFQPTLFHGQPTGQSIPSPTSSPASAASSPAEAPRPSPGVGNR